MQRSLRIALIGVTVCVSILPVSAQTTFNVSVASKTAAHPYFNQGHNEGYVIDGVEGREVVVMRGTMYTFQMNGVPEIHPFYISTSATGGGAEPYSDGVTGNFATGNGVLTFTPSATAPNQLYYQCSFHPNMGWRINVQGTISAIEGSIETRGAAMLAYPNPSSGRSTIALRSGTSSRVRISVFDALGRNIATLFDGDVGADRQLSVPFDVSGLSSGTYVLHATGTGISTSMRFIVR